MPTSQSNNIEIAVHTQFIKQESQPEAGRYVFAYTIKITNHNPQPVKLLSRYWHICDANEKVQEVHGEGVVGHQPRLVTGQSFEYTSGAIIETAFGTMEGNYQFITDSGDVFAADIPLFMLADRATLH